MTARELYKAGHLSAAIQALVAELRDNPGDAQRRTFLFELLCFAGDYDRAEKHLALLADGGKAHELGALLYRSALYAERTRQDTFTRGDYAAMAEAEENLAGTLNDRPFTSIADADPRIGARLEIFAAGSYLLLPLAHLAEIRMEPPRRLRDLLWAPAFIRTGPSFKGRELGEVLVPVLSPLTATHADDQVRLGRMSVWQTDEQGNDVSFGQKMLLVDGEEFPLLEVRSLRIEARPASAAAEAGEGN